MPIVYLATNKRNGKRYIGATVKTLDARRRAHQWDAHSRRGGCRVFNAAIRKYGSISFDWTILRECETREEAFQQEIVLIAELKPEYNLTRGGQGIVGAVRTEQWKRRMSEALKGRKPTPERVAMLNAVRPDGFKSVVCLNDGMFFRSLQDAAAWYGLEPQDVGRAARGEQHATGPGLSFVLTATPMTNAERNSRLSDIAARRLDGLKRQGNRTNHRPKRERLKKTAEQISVGRFARAAALRRGVEKNSKLVKCIETGVLYKSISDAARAHGVCVASMSSAIHRNGRSKGLAFRFTER